MRWRELSGCRLLLGITIVFYAKSISAEDAQVAIEDGVVLTEAQSKRVEQAVDASLAWLAGRQQADGSFPGPASGQPGITSLVVLAFFSAGHVPGSEPYGRHIERAIDYALSCELEDGFFSAAKPRPVWKINQASHTAYYNQAITALMLAEISGELQGVQGKRVLGAVERALAFAKQKQFRHVPGRPQDEGGWRYPQPAPEDNFVTDLSVTAWQVTFLRSAKNAGFNVDDQMVEAARKYVKGMFKPHLGSFTYDHGRTSRGMTGAGIMAMAMLGEHEAKEVEAAVAWLEKHPFARYGERVGHLDRFQYSVYYCTLAMYQVGGNDWKEFFPKMVELLVAQQRRNGSWPAVSYERMWGDVYATAMSTLSLTPHFCMLPIHQR